jgi:hypothetical protein
LSETSILADLRQETDTESDYSKVTQLLMDEKFKRRKTVLNNNRQVGLITTLDVIGQIYDIPFLKKYVDWYAEYLTSIDAKGRNDIVDISKFRHLQQEKINSQLLELAGRK